MVPGTSYDLGEVSDPYVLSGSSFQPTDISSKSETAAEEENVSFEIPKKNGDVKERIKQHGKEL